MPNIQFSVATGCLHNVFPGAGLNVFHLQWLLPSSWCTCCPVCHGAQSSSPTHLQRCDRWTTHSVSGVVSCWAGLQGCPVPACWQNLVGPALKDCRQAGCSLSVRVCAFPGGLRCPLPGIVFLIAAGLAGSWADHAQELCLSVGAVMPHMCGVVPGCLPSLARHWFASQVRPSLDSAFRHRVVGSASSLSVVHFPLPTLAVSVGPDSRVNGCSASPTHARLWGLARWGHDPFRRMFSAA